MGASWVARASGPSDAARLSDDESDCIDSERCLLREVEATSRSVDLDDGDAAGDGKLIAVKSNKGSQSRGRGHKRSQS